MIQKNILHLKLGSVFSKTTHICLSIFSTVQYLSIQPTPSETLPFHLHVCAPTPSAVTAKEDQPPHQTQCRC